MNISEKMTAAIYRPQAKVIENQLKKRVPKSTICKHHKFSTTCLNTIIKRLEDGGISSFANRVLKPEPHTPADRLLRMKW